jgi:hypothetical protein
LKTTTEAMSEIFTQLTGQNKGVMPLVEACNLILEYVLENGFGGGSSNPLTTAQIEKIKEDVINKIKTQVPIGIMLKDCELIDSKLKFTLSDNSSKELDLVTLINTKVNQSELINYVKKTDITNLITETKADNKYQLKGNYASQSDLENKQDKSTALKLSDVKTEIQKVVGTAPDTLDTLQEIAQALGNDPNKINTILSQLGLKASKQDLDSLKEKVITELRYNNNKIIYKENGMDKEIDLDSYVNPTIKNIEKEIENIVENKGNTLFESKDNTIVKNLAYDSANKKITYKINNEIKEIKLSQSSSSGGGGNSNDLDGNTLLDKINQEAQSDTILNFKTKLDILDKNYIFNEKELSENITDLNSLSDNIYSGYYIISGNIEVERIKKQNNFPLDDVQGMLFVYIHSGQRKGIQEYYTTEFDSNTNELKPIRHFIRYYSTYTWTDWQELTNNTNTKKYDTFTIENKLVPEKINETLHLNGVPYSIELYAPVDTTIPELNSSFKSEGYIIINGSEQEIYMYHASNSSSQDLKFKYIKENKTLKVESGYNINGSYMLEVKYL